MASTDENWQSVLSQYLLVAVSVKRGLNRSRQEQPADHDVEPKDKWIPTH